jgi:glycerophosphoryl diester phosphodiesterase
VSSLGCKKVRVCDRQTSLICNSVYISFVTALIRRLAPPPGHSGLQHIVETWKEPDADGAFQFEWRDDFSRDIVPKNCHSHNDYWRSVPLYAALAAGCVSVEADIWLTDDEELLVSHSWMSTNRDRTLKSLYLDPLTNILENRNVTAADEEDKEIGIFETDPTTTTNLLIDFKSDGAATWPVLLRQLAPLREKNWLTYYDGETLHQGPLTIVGTGNTPFDLVQANSTDRYIFFDAPLLEISDEKYDKTNSYYASAPLKGAVGILWFNKLSSSQISTIEEQVKAAEEKGLKSRYWDTPSWPIGNRDEIWRQLMRAGVGMLNVDDLVSATRWNWGWCVVAGLSLCGNS